MFKNLKILDVKQDRSLTYNSVNDFSFARQETVCPIMLTELITAARFFPIVFPTTEPVIPQAVLSVQKQGNRYVADDGSWQGSYVPMHLRRYPFVLGQHKDSDKLVIMYDADAPQLQDNKGKALFEEKDGQVVPSQLLKEINRYLTDLDTVYQKTKQLFDKLKQQAVLDEAELKITDGDSKRLTVKGFSIVNWDKVKQLDDATLAAWARNGLIQFIHIHLLSIEGIHNL